MPRDALFSSPFHLILPSLEPCIDVNYDFRKFPSFAHPSNNRILSARKMISPQSHRGGRAFPRADPLTQMMTCKFTLQLFIAPINYTHLQRFQVRASSAKKNGLFIRFACQWRYPSSHSIKISIILSVLIAIEELASSSFWRRPQKPIIIISLTKFMFARFVRIINCCEKNSHYMFHRWMPWHVACERKTLARKRNSKLSSHKP